MATFLWNPWRLLGLALALLPFTHACCDLDDPISFNRMCTNNSVRADTPFLVKSINYTQYTDTFAYDPVNNPWNALTIFLARSTRRPGCEGTGCSLMGPVCRLIECLPLVQDPTAATNNGKTIITDFLAEIPGDAGPDGAYYNIAATLFNTQNYGFAIPYVSNNSTDANYYNSSLKYANNWGDFNVTDTKPQPGTNQDGFYDFEVNPIPESYDDSWPVYLATVPCPAYGCARACVNELYPKDIHTADAFIPVEQCIGACPGMDTYINYCPDLGGQEQDFSRFGAETGLGNVWKDFIPDGCAQYEGEAFPKAAASLSASLASASASSMATRTGTAASSTSATSTSQGTVLRGGISWDGLQFRGLALPLVVSLLWSTV